MKNSNFQFSILRLIQKKVNDIVRDNLSQNLIIFPLLAIVSGISFYSVTRDSIPITRASERGNISATRFSSAIRPDPREGFLQRKRNSHISFAKRRGFNGAYASKSQQQRTDWLASSASANSIFPADGKFVVYEIERNYLSTAAFLDLQNKHQVYFNGKLFYSICGLGGFYSKVSGKAKEVQETIKKMYLKSKNILTLLFSDVEYNDDHLMVKVFREAHHVDKRVAFAVRVPGPYNAVRTNNRYGVELYTSYDFRIDPELIMYAFKQTRSYTGGYTMRSLTHERFDQSYINWVETVLKANPDQSILLEELFVQMQNGFDVGLQHDVELMNKFYQKFDRYIDDQDSVLIFQNQLLLISHEYNVESFKAQLRKYGTNTDQIITKNHALQLFLDGAVEQQQVRMSLENFITSQKYRRFAQNARNRNVEDTIFKAKTFIEERRYNLDFDPNLAYKALSNFKKQIKDVVRLDFKELQTKLNTTVQIGYLYNSINYNGNNLDFTVETALW